MGFNEINDLFEPLSNGKKGVRNTQEGINIHGEHNFYLLRGKGITPSEIIEKSEQDVFFILNER